jgi:hypothetical protein
MHLRGCRGPKPPADIFGAYASEHTPHEAPEQRNGSWSIAMPGAFIAVYGEQSGE